MSDLVAMDIGGTNARFALATLNGKRVAQLDAEVVLKTAEFPDLQSAWARFAQQIGRALPRAASVAVACPVNDDLLKLTNNPWVIRQSLLPSQLGVDRLTVINDFAAVSHTVAQCASAQFRHVCGPDEALPIDGVISVVGPGTGLGVGLLQRSGGAYDVIATEGGHMGFAPLDDIDDAILAILRKRFTRVSIERIVSGPGLKNIYEALASIEGRSVQIGDDKAVWQAAMAGDDSLAVAALDRFLLAFGACAGDIALAHGAKGVVLAGGVGLRLADRLAGSGFAQRFVAKGRFEAMMARIPVKLITHPQPGLLGAAAAFGQEHVQ